MGDDDRLFFTARTIIVPCARARMLFLWFVLHFGLCDDFEINYSMSNRYRRGRAAQHTEREKKHKPEQNRTEYKKTNKINKRKKEKKKKKKTFGKHNEETDGVYSVGTQKKKL